VANPKFVNKEVDLVTENTSFNEVLKIFETGMNNCLLNIGKETEMWKEGRGRREEEEEGKGRMVGRRGNPKFVNKEVDIVTENTSFNDFLKIFETGTNNSLLKVRRFYTTCKCVVFHICVNLLLLPR
jgi:hypothetical protein